MKLFKINHPAFSDDEMPVVAAGDISDAIRKFEYFYRDSFEVSVGDIIEVERIFQKSDIIVGVMPTL